MKFKITSTRHFFSQVGKVTKQYIGIFDSEEEAEKFIEERFQ